MSKPKILQDIDNINSQLTNLNTTISYAQQEGDYAKSKGDLANTATINANNATTNANTATTNANNAVISANTAITNANTATTNANNATTNANTTINNINNNINNNMLMIYKPSVSTFSAIATTYTTGVQTGWTVQTTDTMNRYRYDGISTWVNIGKYVDNTSIVISPTVPSTPTVNPIWVKQL